jgi:hypothetical protein
MTLKTLYTFLIVTVLIGLTINYTSPRPTVSHINLEPQTDLIGQVGSTCYTSDTGFECYDSESNFIKTILL